MTDTPKPLPCPVHGEPPWIDEGHDGWVFECPCGLACLSIGRPHRAEAEAAWNLYAFASELFADNDRLRRVERAGARLIDEYRRCNLRPKTLQKRLAAYDAARGGG